MRNQLVGRSSLSLCAFAALTGGVVSLGMAKDPQPPNFGEGVDLPRTITPAELDWLEANPFVVRMTPPSVVPTGPLLAPGEYAPSSGIIFSYQGQSGVLSILRQMVRHVTTTGNAKAYINVSSNWSATQRQGLLNQLTSGGADVSKVELIPYTTNAIWLRDYGPRYVYEGDVRVIVDHDYNVTTRMLDDAQPVNFSAYKRHARYHNGLRHGGGNYHLDSVGRGHATRLITNENPTLSEATVLQRFQNYWGVSTTLYNPFRTSVDGTQHIDMWMQVIDDNKVIISDWPNNANVGIEDAICDAAAISLTAAGYQVFRTPAFSIFDSFYGNVHYTYTNVVMCNDVVMIPYYDRISSMVPQNAIALAAWQAAMPDKTIVQIDSDALVILSGVMHCIVMHMPVHKGQPGVNGGLAPTALVRTPAADQVFNPASPATFRWIADDDVAVTSFDVLLSVNGGQSFPRVLASNASAASLFDASDGTFRVSSSLAGIYFTDRAVVRVVARDAVGNQATVDSAEFTINGPVCIGDYDNSSTVDLADLLAFLSDWSTLLGSTSPGAACDMNGDTQIDLLDLLAFVPGWQSGCP